MKRHPENQSTRVQQVPRCLSQAAIMMLLLAAVVRNSAGEFINLTFNDGKVTPQDIASGGNSTGTIDRLLPGWQLFVNDTQPYTGLIAWGSPHDGMPFALFSSLYAQLEYGLWIDTRELPSSRSDPGWNIIHVRQTATIPTWAAGLQVYGPLRFTINGQYPDPALGNDYLKPWAGQQVTLDFGNQDPNTGAIISPVTGENGPIDILGFYAIPEPSTWALLASGLGALIWSRRWEGRAVEGSGWLPPGCGREGTHCRRCSLASRWVGVVRGLAR